MLPYKVMFYTLNYSLVWIVYTEESETAFRRHAVFTHEHDARSYANKCNSLVCAFRERESKNYEWLKEI